MPTTETCGTAAMQPHTRQRGQTLVEFAFVCLLFLVLLFGIVEFSRAFWTWNTIVQATRSGARFAVVEMPTSTDDQVKNFVVYHNSSGSGSPILPGLSTANVTVQYLKNDGTDSSAEKYKADIVQIGISNYAFTFLVPIFGSGIALPPFTTTLPVEGLGST